MNIVVIPCRNEEASIGALVTVAKRYVDVVVVVDDGSTDGTASAAEINGAVVIKAPPDRAGLAAVYRHGLEHALTLVTHDRDVIVEMDAGGSHNPEALPNFTREYSLVQGRGDWGVRFGTRFGRGFYRGHWKRKMLSRLGTWLVNAVHGTRFTDATSGYVGYQAWALKSLLHARWRGRGHYYQTEVRLRAVAQGLPHEEVPIAYHNSGSSLNARSIVEALRLVWRR